MGNLQTIEKKTATEFERVRAEGKSSRQYLTIDKVLKMQLPEIVRDCPFTLAHLGILYVMDQKKTGKFYLEDVLTFVRFVYQKQTEQSRDISEQNKFQAYCSILMWNNVRIAQGSQEFIAWMCRCFTAIVKPREFKKWPGVRFIHTDSMKTLYEVLNIRRDGMGFLTFWNILQYAAEEKEQTNLDLETLDDWVPESMLEILAKEFVAGFLNMMQKLGFESEVFLA